uniref:Ion transport domain-containing protein n=1 Tax=Fagus sylvatica TaxID=28930 RepID=A0A2N9HPF1_FAGSY
MGYESSKFVRFQDDANNGLAEIDLNDNNNDTWIPEPGTNNYEEEVPWKAAKSLKAKVLSRVFSEDYEKAEKKILDPRGLIIRRWNKIFLVACLVSLSLDPLFFYLPVVHDEVCIAIAVPLEVILTLISVHCYSIPLKFHTAYVAPSSRVFGRGELVIDSSKIAMRYLKRGFFIDLIAALPLPQVLTWEVIPNVRGYCSDSKEKCHVNQHGQEISYALPVGAWWYLLAIERQEVCWRSACDLEQPNCQNGYFDCRNINDDSRTNWVNSTNVTNLCVPTPIGIPVFYQYGIDGDAVNTNVIASRFFSKYFYCLWWGLRNLSSNILAQLGLARISDLGSEARWLGFWLEVDLGLAWSNHGSMARIAAQWLRGSDLEMVLARDLSSVARWLGSISAHENRIKKRTAVQSTRQRDRVVDPVLRTTGRAASQTRMFSARVAHVRLGARDSERRNLEMRVERVWCTEEIPECLGRAWRHVR